MKATIDQQSFYSLYYYFI